MKICAVALCLTVVPVAAFAQVEPLVPYAEAAAGAAFLNDFRSKSFSGVVDGTPVTIKAQGTYYPAVGLGVEAGLAGLDYGMLRAGGAFDYLSLTLRRARLTGTIGGTPVDSNFTRDQLSAMGFNLDNTTYILGGHLYLNLPSPSTRFVQPYVGFGGGAAFVQKANTVPAAALTAGLRFPLAQTGYFGVRYRLYYVAGPKDDLGIQYASILAHTVSATIGLYFQ